MSEDKIRKKVKRINVAMGIMLLVPVLLVGLALGSLLLFGYFMSKPTELARLEFPPDMEVEFYTIDTDWDVGFDLQCKVSRQGRLVYDSHAFPYGNVHTSTETPHFDYHQLDDRYIAVYDRNSPKEFIIVMDLLEGLYGALHPTLNGEQ